jgi:hypothetical protein
VPHPNRAAAFRGFLPGGLFNVCPHKRGHISEPAHLTIQGDWKATLEHQCAGDVVKVAVAIESQNDGDLAVVVTVMN